MAQQSRPLNAGTTLAAVLAVLAMSVAAEVKWYPPSERTINDLDKVMNGHGVYGFIYNSSVTPDDKYGEYNWCNMPHVRKKEYMKMDPAYELMYVEVVSIYGDALFGSAAVINKVCRSIATTSVRHMRPTLSQSSRIPGIAMTSACTTTASHKRAKRLLGRSLRDTTLLLIPLSHLDGTVPASFPRSRWVDWRTRANMATIYFTSIMM